ncbi:MAG: autotransporter outer membrane beta-barrel domain-containing protein, partial [Sinobacteraceae bacterium]|nr:autotransporter outer membrane beta-barrel domain-containing protein [Nevskiaceae bacterium]
AGTLEVGDKDHTAASIQGNVTVSAQGTLRGHGTIGDATTLITNNAIVRPGGSIGDMNIPGSYTQSSSGTLMIDISPTAASHLIVGGTATLNGTLMIVYGPGTYSPKTYPGIVSAGGGITDNTTKTSKGKPGGIAQTVAFNGPNALDLTLAFAGTTVITPTNATIFGTAGAAALRDSQRVNGLLLDRLDDVCGECAAQPLWARATGTDTRIDGNNGAPDARDKRYGFLAGFDHHLDNKATVGLAVGYSHADVTEDTGDAKAKLDTLRLAAYAGKRLGPVNVSGTLGYAYNFISTTRSFGSLGNAKDSGHGQLFTAAAQAGLPWALGRATFTPSLGLRYAHLDGFGLNESGPTSQNLDVNAQHAHSLQPFAAVTLDYPLNLAADKPAHLKVRLGYAYETLDASHDVSLASIDGTRFVIPGTNDSRGMLSAGLGLDLPVSKAANAYIRYDTVFHTGNVSAQSVQAGFSYRF